MTYHQWWSTQDVELGQTDHGEHHWRCPVCRCWAGPYTSPLDAKGVAMKHRYEAHDLPAARRTEARKAARKVGGQAITAAALNDFAGHLAADSALSTTTAHLLIHRVAITMQGYGHAADLVKSIDRDGLTRSAQSARTVVDAIAAWLGRPGWLDRMGA